MKAADLLVVYGGRPGEGLVFAPDGSGWAGYSTGSDDPESLVFVRFGRVNPHPRLVVVSMLVEKFGQARGIEARDLRAIPLGRLELAVNTPDVHPRVVALIEELERQVVPFPEDAFVQIDGENQAPWWMLKPSKPRSPRLKLRIPDTHKKPDSFYEQVAERFGYLSVVSERPAAELAEANSVPVTTVHGWVREARRRGLLASGERGGEQ